MTIALVVVPVLSESGTGSTRTGGNARSPAARLEEAIGLANAIGLDVVHSEIVQVAQPRPATLIGTGKTAQLAKLVSDSDIDLVIFDYPLSPVQQRNLETELNAKVLDRTGLILEIFGRRAQTREGVIQVQLAHLNYQRGRLVRSWTHLERQRGGAGFLGGPGETQIEADRRLLQEKIQKLKRQLETVRRTRSLHRKKRKKVPFPIVAIVGYTNAGKSTLFNRLTGAGVVAEDQLFATLDPTLRRLQLPQGTIVLLSDTVGFISDLPTHLVAAFRATLEEVVEADVILHVRDIADPDRDAQAEDVRRILEGLAVNSEDPDRVIEVWNKIDLVDKPRRDAIAVHVPKKGAPAVVAVSAVTGEGIDRLKAEIETLAAGNIEHIRVHVSTGDHHMTGWLYEVGNVTCRIDNEDGSVDIDLRSNSRTIGYIRERVTKEAATPAHGGDRSRILEHGTTGT